MGYVGREVDSIVKDLVDVAVKLTREQEMDKVRHRAMDSAEERVLDALLPRPRPVGFGTEPRVDSPGGAGFSFVHYGGDGFVGLHRVFPPGRRL